MYALENVRKFVADNATRLGDRAQGILTRAEGISENGVFSGGAIGEVLQDEDLKGEFCDLATTDPNHIRIGLAAIAASRS